MNASAAIRPGDRVTLHYRLACGEQVIVDTFADGAPETFTLGSGEIDARLEMLLLNLGTGDARSFDLAPGEAFGARDPALLHRLPRGEFAADLLREPNGGVQFELPNGQTLNGTIREVGDDDVLVDFNHPLAGLPVLFSVQILAVEPT